MSDRAVYFLSALYNQQQQHNIDWLLSVDIVVNAAWCCPRCAGQVSVSASKCCTVRFPFEETNFLSHQDFVWCCLFIHYSIFPVYFKLFSFLFSNAADIYFLQFFNSLISPISNLFLLSFTTGIYIFSVWQKDNQAGSGASTDRC